MSEPAVLSLPFEIIYDDGIPLESNWHVTQGDLLKGLILWAMKERGRSDFFTGCNMFVYYSYDQARAIAADLYGPYLYRGPDIFYVGGVEARNRTRKGASGVSVSASRSVFGEAAKRGSGLNGYAFSIRTGGYC